MSGATPRPLSDRLAALSPPQRRILEKELAARGARAHAPIPCRAEGEGPFPTSFAQRRIWLLEQLEPGVHHVATRQRLRARVRLPWVRRALCQVVDRHASLRTTFEEKGGLPVQRVHSASGGAVKELQVPFIDLRRLPEETAEAEGRELLHRQSRRLFDLRRLPLLRVALAQLGGQDFALLLTMHHIISDDVSVLNFSRELELGYAAAQEGRDADLPPLPIQMPDFALWQREHLTAEVLEGHLDYYRRLLAAAPPGIELPLDRPRPPAQTYRGGLQGVFLSSSLSAAWRALSRAQGRTLFVTFLAAFVALLHRVSGEADIVLGSPVANRNREEVEALIGSFVNTLVVRARIQDDPTWTELVEELGRQVLAAQSHQDLPFERLIEELQPERSLERPPLFQVVFITQKGFGGHRESAEDRRPATRFAPVRPCASRFDLTLRVTDGPRPLAFALEYSRDLFDDTRVGRWTRQLVGLLEELVLAPDRPLSALPLLSRSERHQLLHEWNDTAAAPGPEELVPAQLRRRIADSADRVAVRFRDGFLSYAELGRRSEGLAARLACLGVCREVPVALALERCEGMVVALLATWWAGGFNVPLDPSYPAERLAFMLADSGARVLLRDAHPAPGATATADSLPSPPAPLAPPAGGTVIELTPEGRLAEPPPSGGLRVPLPAVPIHPLQLAYVIYTSGSTGRPKAVAIAHRALVNFLAAMREQPGFSPRERLLAVASLSFDSVVLELYLTLTRGGEVVLTEQAERVDGARLARRVAQVRSTLLQATPATWRLMLNAGWSGQPGLRGLCGGEAMPGAMAVEVDRRLDEMWNLYGPTETTVWSTLERVRKPAAGKVPTLGRPIRNTTIRIVDRAFRPVVLGSPGELVIGGEGLARGYRGRPGLTSERFVADPTGSAAGGRLYRTGDLARWQPDGGLEYLGRIDHQVKLRGYRIELGEIEVCLISHPRVREAVVLLRELDGEEALVAYWVAEATAEGADEATVESHPAQLRAFLGERLPTHMVPAIFILLPELPLTPNRKLDRSRLPLPERAAMGGASDTATPPRGLTESLLASIWEEVLEVEGVSSEDDFFALGGHSLLATGVLSRLREIWGVEIPLRVLFDRPRLADLAAEIDRARRRDVQSLPPLAALGSEPEAGWPLSFAQQRLWFLDRLEPLSAAYNLPLAVRLAGPLQPGPLAHALREVLRRHRVLRTRFPTRGPAPVQEVCAVAWRPLPAVDLSHLAEVDREVTMRSLVTTVARQPFDLAAGPLFRALLLRLGSEDHVAAVTLHHIVSDGWSISLLSRELGALYAAFTAGRPSPLPELPVQYVDFALWQRGWLSGERLAAEVSFWRAALAGAPPLHALPTDRPRPAVRTSRGGLSRITLTPGMSRDLRAGSRRLGATSFMTLLAAFLILLRRWGGEEDVVVGTPVAGRHYLATEELIGFFVNTLALRVRPRPAGSAERTFAGLVGRVREAALDAQEHQDLPFEKLVEELRPERSLSHTPILQITFTVQTFPRRPLELGEVSLRPLPETSVEAKFDLSLDLVDEGERVGGAFLFNADLFDATTLARRARELDTLLAAALSAPDSPLEALPSLAAAERHQLLLEGLGAEPGAHHAPRSALPVAEASTLHAWLERSGARHPEATALVFGDAWWSYGELLRRAHRLAHRLVALGVRAETRVGLLVESSFEMVVGIVGTLAAGGAYLPLDAAWPRERLDTLLAEAFGGEGEGPLVLTTRELASRLGGGDAPALRPVPRLLLLDAAGSEVWGYPAGSPAVDVMPAHPAYVLFTSGSTGRPKGVVVPHASLTRLFSATASRFAFGRRDVWTLFHSHAFDFSVWELWGALLHGGRAVGIPTWTSRSPEHFVGLLLRHRVTVLNQTPSAFRPLVREVARQAAFGDLALRWILFGGEPLRRADVEPWWRGRAVVEGSRQTARLANLYGITETTVHVTWRELTTADLDNGSWGTTASPIGTPLPDLDLFVVDPRGELAALGVPGEARIRGAGVARGYLGQPALTASRFLPDPFAGHSLGAGEREGGRLYASGDRVRLRPDGQLEHLGRLDAQVQLRGFRIEPGEIEAALRTHLGVGEAHVQVETAGPASPPASVADPRLVAYVVELQPGSAPEGELRRLLRRRLPEVMLPSLLVHLPSLPLTPNGKVDRRALAESRTAPRGARQAGRAGDALAGIWRSLLGREEVDPHTSFFDLGGHSLLVVEMQHRLREELGWEVSILDLFRHPTLASLGDLRAPRRPVRAPRPGTDRPGSGAESATEHAIAVIGLAGRFPGAAGPEELWRNLVAGRESIHAFSDAELLAAGVSRRQLEEPSYVKARGILERIEWFDAPFFGMTPREAQITDPQHRIFLECAWEALERAAIDPGRFAGDIGVYAGVGFNSYWFHLLDHPELVGSLGPYVALIGNDKDYLPTRVSYKLGLRGPSINVQTACSTSLVATHLACRALLGGECDLALAGGVTVSAEQAGYVYAEGGIVSPDGHCRPFDAAAQGTVAGSGSGVVVLRRLDDALAAGDPIHAVIRGSAVNNDGSAKIGFTAPAVDGQVEVIRRALVASGVSPESIGYVEAHGTATALGDPIEVAALAAAYASSSPPDEPRALGSVKSNLGHLDAAAGVTGLIKAVLAIEHAQIPPSLHFETPNPRLDLTAGNFRVNTELADWPASASPRRAAVSAFGLGGTNAHVILEQAPATAPSGSSRRWQLLLLSARSEAALAVVSERLAEHLSEGGRKDPRAHLADVAHTLRTGRAGFEHRRFVLCDGRAGGEVLHEAAAALRRELPPPGSQGRGAATPPPVTFLLPGQGTQYLRMGRQLYAGEPAFRVAFDLCSEKLIPRIGHDLRRLLDPPPREEEASARLLAGNAVAQPALFAVQVSLARLWESWGVRPAAVIAQSAGEVAAAHLAGVLDLDDGLALVAARGRLMQSLPPGRMLILPLSEEAIAPRLGPEISVAAINTPTRVVVSGPIPAVDALAAQLAAEGVEGHALQTQQASHSPAMEPILGAFAAEVRKLRPQPPKRPWVSNLTGSWITPEEASDPLYWVRQLRSPVRFSSGVEVLAEELGGAWLEVGPGRSLSTLIRQHPAWSPSLPVIASMRHARDEEEDLQVLAQALGQLWVAGVEIGGEAFSAREKRRRVCLPTYPFERQRHWLDRVAGPTRAAAGSRAARGNRAAAGRWRDPGDWFSIPVWKLTSPLPASAPGISAEAGQAPAPLWLVFEHPAHPRRLADSLAASLRNRGIEVVRVQPGAGFARLAPDLFEVAPESADDHAAVLGALPAGPAALERILHLWGLAEAAGEEGLALGFGSLVALGHALERQRLSAPPEIVAVTSGAVAVHCGERARPEQAACLAPLQVLTQEYPGLRARGIDFQRALERDVPQGAGPASEPSPEGGELERLLREIFVGEEALVALRGCRRLRREFAPLYLGASPSGTESPYRQSGVYLLIGGLGRIGLSLAEDLARRAEARLVLVGRTLPPPRDEWEDWLARHGEDDATSRRILRLRRVEEAGGEVLMLAADAADPEQMRTVLALSRERFGRLDGVFHLASVAHAETFRPISETTSHDLARHLRAKVRVVEVLEGLLAELPAAERPDLCVLFSSLASFLGGLGFAAYGAANLYLDAWAEARGGGGGGLWMSINWEAWLPPGTSVAETGGLGGEVARWAIRHEEGMDALARAVAAGARGQIVVSTGDLDHRLERWRHSHAGPGGADMMNAGERGADAVESASLVGPGTGLEPPPSFSRPALSTPYVPPETEVERSVVGLWEQFLGLQGVGIEDNFYELGGDSLLATQVISRLRTVFRAELPMSSLFETPTVAGLAAALGAGLAEQAESDRLDAILQRIEGLSPEEIAARLECGKPERGTPATEEYR